jgi:thiamine biosynthesis lipoprotein
MSVAAAMTSGIETVWARAMGTDVTITIQSTRAGLGNLMIEELDGYEQAWSRFIPTSEISRLNAADGQPCVVSAPTYDLVARAAHAAAVTGGAFNPLLLHRLIALGYDRDHAALTPPPFAVRPTSPSSSRARATTEPDEANAPPRAAAIRFDPIVRAITLPAGTAFDPGGLGKGTAARLCDLGVDSATIDLGGDIRVVGRPVNGDDRFTVMVEDPFNAHDVPAVCLRLGGGAVATSSRLKRRWMHGGVEQHHLIDPVTNAPAQRGLASVTVIAADAAWAEVFAKAVLIRGRHDGATLLANAGLTGLAFTDEGDLIQFAGLEGFLA